MAAAGDQQDPNRAVRRLSLAARQSARRCTLEGTFIMARKPKPETTDEAREQARRALQTSMDTRQ